MKIAASLAGARNLCWAAYMVRMNAKVYGELCEAVEELIELTAKDGHSLPEPLANKEFSDA
jgi:hypothetical protein